jgi:hypothetical protein
LFKTANKAKVTATKVTATKVTATKAHVIHPTKLQFPSTQKTSLFHDTANDTITIKIISFASYLYYLYLDPVNLGGYFSYDQV